MAENEAFVPYAIPAESGHEAPVNVSQTERWASVLGGAGLVVCGLRRGSYGGITLALLGGALLHRGVSGYCSLYEALNIKTLGGGREHGKVSVPGNRGVKVEESVTIRRSPEVLYRFWRDFENLPMIMDHLVSVTSVNGGRTHWVVRGVGGRTVQWDAEVINDKENRMIAWRSLEGADVPNAGSVHFDRETGEVGTRVRVVLEYDPPGGSFGAALARFFGENPKEQIRADLFSFKNRMESQG